MHPYAIRCELLYCSDDPDQHPDAVRHWQDGVVLVEGGLITHSGAWSEIGPTLSESIPVHHRPYSTLVPGFVDCHIHFPQVQSLACRGTQLLDWLTTYTYPAEMAFADPAHAEAEARFFVEQLLAQGTTTALVFASVHPQSVEALFTQAQRRRMRLIAGKVLMDRNAPEGLRDDVESGERDSRALIERWHGVDRLAYAVTPRFAPTCTPEQLRMAGRLLQDYDGLYLHTHLAENHDEIAMVAELFPEAKDYLDVYDQAGLLGERSVFAHSLHLSDEAWQRLGQSRSSVAHCPCSNLFIGSGLFPLRQAQRFGVEVGLGSDVGGGDSFSLLRVANEAYKVQQLQNHNVTPEKLLYLATLGGARTLRADQHIGQLAPGFDADFVLLDQRATSLMAHRLQSCRNWRERIFALMMLGDERCVTTVVAGEAQNKPGVHPRITSHR